MATHVWTTKDRVAKAVLLADVIDAPLMLDAPLGDCDVVHIVGVADSPRYDHTLSCTRRAGTRVFHWSAQDARTVFEPERLTDALHICETEEAREALADRGLVAEVLPWPVRPNVPVGPLPAQKRVTAYLGADPHAFCSEVVRSLQMVFEAEGIEFAGYLEADFDDRALAGVIRRTTVHVRLSDHETDLHSARAFMEAGRRAVTSNPLEHAKVVRQDDLPKLISTVRALLAEEEPDHEAAAYWAEHNREDWFRTRLEEIL